MRRLVITSALALGLVAAPLALADPGAPPPGGQPPPSGPGGQPPPMPPECFPPGVAPGTMPPPGYQPPPDWRPPAHCPAPGGPPNGPNGPGGPGGPGQPGAGPGGPGGGFAPAFFSRNWKVLGEVLLTDTLQGKRVIDFNVTKLINPPKHLKDEGKEVADQGALVIVGPKVAITEDGDRITFADLDPDDKIVVTGKFLRNEKWLEDEDGDPVPTIRAKRIVVA
jgi:hypothetical protein